MRALLAAAPPARGPRRNFALNLVRVAWFVPRACIVHLWGILSLDRVLSS